MNRKWILLLALGVGLVAVLAVVLTRAPDQPPREPRGGIDAIDDTDGIEEPAPEPNILIEVPRPGDAAENPILVRGKARVFEQTFAYRLRDAAGRVVEEGHSMTRGPGGAAYGEFEVRIPVPPGSSGKVTVEVFQFSAKDGSVTDLVSVPVEMRTTEEASVSVFFSNGRLDPAVTCEKVFPVPRPVLRSREPAWLAVNELLQGPTEAEQAEGYRTNLPEGVRLRSLRIENGQAFADFEQTLESGVAGSCRVLAIRAQIAATLRQFPTVREVTVSIEGRTEGILQP